VIRPGVVRMVARLALLFALSTVGAAASFAQAKEQRDHKATVTVSEYSFRSIALNRTMKYIALLPTGYERSRKNYPVLYLLHGWNGDFTNWTKLTSLSVLAQNVEFIIVTPDAQNSWYVDSATVAEDRFQKYVVSDLIEEVDARFRTIAAAEGRAIAGLSMGGYGAVVLSLKNPEKFAFAGSISGAFDGPSGAENLMPELSPSIEQAYGGQANSIRTENDVYRLAKLANPKLTPYFYVACGSSDPFLAVNRDLAEVLGTNQMRYEYHEFPGAHTWEFWDYSLPMLLNAVSRSFGLQSRVLSAN
jgi:putative tributyrin esterase